MLDYRIHTFLVLYETMNYRRTGELLNLSQPAVSQQIHSLEKEYGCRLFRYDGRQLFRTPQAEVVARYARAARYNESQMLLHLADPNPRPVRIGATKTIGEFVAADPLCRYLAGTHDSVSVTVDNTEALLHQLEGGELDFALVEGAFDKNRYGYALYQKARFTGICRKDHPFAGKTVSPSQLAGQCAILREKGSGTRAILENALKEQGYSTALFSRVICASSFSLILRFVSEGLGITFAYRAAAQNQESLTFFHLEGLAEQHEFNIVFLQGTEVLPLARNILGCKSETESAPILSVPETL